MFRRWVALLAVMLTVMVGCHPKTPRAQPNTAEFSCDIRAIYKELAVAGSLTRHSIGTLELAFTEPATLNGLTAVWDGETVTMHLYGLSFSTDPAAIPEDITKRSYPPFFPDGRGDYHTAYYAEIVDAYIIED